MLTVPTATLVADPHLTDEPEPEPRPLPDPRPGGPWPQPGGGWPWPMCNRVEPNLGGWIVCTPGRVRGATFRGTHVYPTRALAEAAAGIAPAGPGPRPGGGWC